ncbi:hypothetical protein RCL1_001092 [Eukaryota sp. TZLM3-RCL]
MGELFERRFVQEVYDDIADHFSSTRFSVWPAVSSFIDSLSEYSLVCDVGCGNGKNMIASFLKNHIPFGCDSSIELCRLAETSFSNRDALCDVVHGDGLFTNFPSNSFDAVLSIAVVHHFSTVERRLAAVKELYRMSRSGGRVMVTVWAHGQAKMSKWKAISIKNDGEFEFTEKSQDYIIPWHLRKSFINKPQKEDLATDYRGDPIYGRYYHLFIEKELDKLMEDANFAIESSYFDHDNYVVIGRKE